MGLRDENAWEGTAEQMDRGGVKLGASSARTRGREMRNMRGGHAIALWLRAHTSNIRMCREPRLGGERCAPNLSGESHNRTPKWISSPSGGLAWQPRLQDTKHLSGEVRKLWAPGAAPGRPGAAAGRPGAALRRPGAAPGRPGAAPRRPGAAPRLPGAAPELPGAAPGRPGAAPRRPGAALGRPGAASGACAKLACACSWPFLSRSRQRRDSAASHSFCVDGAPATSSYRTTSVCGAHVVTLRWLSSLSARHVITLPQPPVPAARTMWRAFGASSAVAAMLPRPASSGNGAVTNSGNDSDATAATAAPSPHMQLRCMRETHSYGLLRAKTRLELRDRL
eukprot:353477-Chlamydomonas_euryale.AAC.5